MTCIRDGRILFRHLDLDLAPGQVIQVEGANGAGKTTLLRVLCGLLPPQEGDIHWCGTPLEHCRPQFWGAMCHIGHQPAVKGDLTPRENLAFAARLEGLSTAPETLDQALEPVGLWGFEDTPVRALSAGQRRRVALARLWLTRRPLWILDEPLTALDTSGSRALEAHLAAHGRRRGLALVTSHQPLEAVTGSIALTP